MAEPKTNISVDGGVYDMAADNRQAFDASEFPKGEEGRYNIPWRRSRVMSVVYD